MLSLTKKTDYALISLSYLAEQESRTVSAREIASAFEMPTALVMNILKTLHHCGVVCSRRGTKGGYRLAADLSKISVHDLINFLEGPVRLTECSSGEQETRRARNCKVRGCPISAPIQKLHAKLVEHLKQTKLSELLNGMETSSS